MTKLTANKKLQEISKIIIPTMEIFQGKDGTRVLVDRSLYAMISSCLNDLREGKNDELTQKSLEECLSILDTAHEFLDYKRLPENEDVSDIKAILVDFRFNE